MPGTAHSTYRSETSISGLGPWFDDDILREEFGATPPEDRLTVALRAFLHQTVEKHVRPKFGGPVANQLAAACSSFRIESLAEWLRKDGWGLIPDAKLEAAVIAAGEAQGIPAGDKGWCGFVLPGRTERGTPAKAILIHLRRPRNEPPPPYAQHPGTQVDLRAGLAALRALFDSRAWSVLELLREGNDQWLKELGVAWLRAQAKQIEKGRASAPLALQPRNLITAPSTGAEYLRFPSALRDAGAWCGNLVEVDGAMFAEEPDLAAAPVRALKDMLKDEAGSAVTLYKPHAWTVAAAHRLKGPHQSFLPGLLADPEHSPELGAFLAVTATDAAALDLSGLSVKVLLALLAICPLDGTPIKGPVEDLAKIVYPDWRTRRKMRPSRTRRKMRPSKIDVGDVRRTVAAVAGLLGLRVVELLQKTGSLRIYPFLQADYLDVPLTPGAAPELMLRLNKTLAKMASPDARGQGANFMLLNLSRLMELDANKPEAIALAVRLAAVWHMCKQRTVGGRRVYMPERLAFLPVDNLLVETNVQGRAAPVIGGADLGKRGRIDLAEARARIVDDTLPCLKDNGYLDGFDVRRPSRHAGRGAEAWMVKVPPPADWQEASRKTASTRRPPLKGRPRRK